MKAFRILALLAVTGLMASVPAGAGLQFLWPVENGFVRENVNVAVAVTGAEAAQVGYVQFYLNGKFIAAVGFPRKISGGREAYTWAWDTREPINLGGATDAPKRPADGSYEIRAVAVSKDGQQIDSKTISVQLSNQVRSAAGSGPVPLSYRFSPGFRHRYSVTVAAFLTEIGGAPIDPREIQKLSYTGQMEVVTKQNGTDALLRFRPDNTSFSLFGNPMGPLPGFDWGSRYVVSTSKGILLTVDPFSTVGFMTDPAFGLDYFTVLPGASVALGDSWEGRLSASVPMQGAAADQVAVFTLGGLEWASGEECARFDIECTGYASLTGLGFAPTPKTKPGRDPDEVTTGVWLPNQFAFISRLKDDDLDKALKMVEKAPVKPLLVQMLEKYLRAEKAARAARQATRSALTAAARPDTDPAMKEFLVLFSEAMLPYTGPTQKEGVWLEFPRERKRPLGRSALEAAVLSEPTAVSGGGSDWFSIRRGLLVRRSLDLNIETRLESAEVQAITDGLALTPPGEADGQGQSASARQGLPSSAPGDEEWQQAQDYQRQMAGGFGLLGAPGASASAQGAPVKLLLRVTATLMY